MQHPFNINNATSLFILFFSINLFAAPSDHFVTTWETTAVDTVITIPTFPGETYNYTIDWDNDMIPDQTGITGDATHDYGSAGVHTIRIFGTFPRIYINDGIEKDKILSVEQWGITAWSSMQDAFQGASNLVINASDTPDLSSVVIMQSMFDGANNLGNGTGNWNWNTTTIQNMKGMFLNASSFNKDIGSWDTNNVENMQNMFANAISFDQDLSLWNYEALLSSLALFISNTAMSTTNYDKLLMALDAQNLSPGKSMTSNGVNYCSQAAQDARASIIANDGWTISDAGLHPLCVDELFANGFEDVIIVKSAKQQVNYNFSNIIIDELTQTPKLIIVGLDNAGAENIQIHIRNDLGVLQVRVSYLMGEQWQAQQWQDVDNNKTITLQW